MFYPGDPMEQRKRQLISRLAGSRGGKGAGGWKVGRAPGFFGRGVAGGFVGNPGIGRALGLRNNPNMPQGTFESFAPPAFQGPQPFWGASQLPGFGGTQTMTQNPLIRELLANYGQAPMPSTAGGKWGMM